MHLILDTKLFLIKQLGSLSSPKEASIELPSKVKNSFEIEFFQAPYLESKYKTFHKNLLNTPLLNNKHLKNRPKSNKNSIKPFDPSIISNEKGSTFSSSLSFYNIFDINFIKRERLYTKLKYSRSPAYDIVSGGAAAFLAAFIGFLVSEKFGIELVDSGDFYIAFMYAVFIGLAFKPFMRILQSSQSLTSSFLSRLKIIILILLSLPKQLIIMFWKNRWYLLLWSFKLYLKIIFLYYIPTLLALISYIF